MKCPECKSEGFELSVTGKGCTFCDGTEGGNPPKAGEGQAGPRAESLATAREIIEGWMVTPVSGGATWQDFVQRVALALEEAARIRDEGWDRLLSMERSFSLERYEEMAKSLRTSEAALARQEEHTEAAIHSLHLQLTALRERAQSAEAALAEALDRHSKAVAMIAQLCIERESARAEATKAELEARSEREKLESDRNRWKLDCEMYAGAWQREIGPLVSKTHLIDALVLTTRKLRADLAAIRSPQPPEPVILPEGFPPEYGRRLALAVQQSSEAHAPAAPPPPSEEPRTEGWVYLLNSPKFHYMRAGKSLCRRWGYFGSTYEEAQGRFKSKQDCAACWKAREKELEAQQPVGTAE